jgi:hypothetical protein
MAATRDQDATMSIETTSTRRTTRLTAVVAALGLSAGLTLVGAPAHAADPAADYQAVALTDLGTDSDCPIVDEGGEATAAQTIASAGTKKINLTKSSSATVTNTGDSTDTASLAAKSTLTGSVVAKGGAFSSLSLKGTMSARSSAKKGFDSDCDPEAAAGAGIDIDLKVAKAGWLKITVSGSKGLFSMMTLSGASGNGLNLTTIGNKATHVIKRKVKPGVYEFQVFHQLVDFSMTSGLPFSASGTSSIGVVYSTKKP